MTYLLLKVRISNHKQKSFINFKQHFKMCPFLSKWKNSSKFIWMLMNELSSYSKFESLMKDKEALQIWKSRWKMCQYILRLKWTIFFIFTTH